MPRKIGEEIPHRMCFTFLPQNRKALQKAMDNNEFSTVAECINTAIRYYFENKDKPDEQTRFNEWLEMPETRERMRVAMRKVLKEEQEKDRELAGQ